MFRCKTTVYFAHPISLYHKPVAIVIGTALQRLGYEVINPSEPKYQDLYQKHRREQPDENPMTYWLGIASRCEECVAVPFPKGVCTEDVPVSNKPRFGAGVAKEIDLFLHKRRKVSWTPPEVSTSEEVELLEFPNWHGFERLTVEETKALLRAQGTPEHVF